MTKKFINKEKVIGMKLLRQLCQWGSLSGAQGCFV